MRAYWTTRVHRIGQLMAVTSGLWLSPAAFGVDQGSQAPQFEFTSHEQTVKLNDYSGKLVYLDFWASWCGPCRQSFPWMNDMHAKYGQQGLHIIGVNLDAKKEDSARFLATTPANFTVAYDPTGRSAKQYGVKGMPSSVLIGRDGKVLLMHVGFNEPSRVELEKAIVVALAGGK